MNLQSITTQKMTDTRKSVEVCFSPLSFPLFYKEDAIVVVIDVLRATSAICTALHNGVEGIIPVATVAEAMEYKKKGFLTAAERHGQVVEGFDFGNSPFSYMTEEVRGKHIVLTTTNGTQAIEVARKAYKVVIGSFLNLEFLSSWLIEQNRDVILLCAGWKNKFNMEDTLFAGAVATNLFATKNFTTDCDTSRAACLLYEAGENNIYDFLENSSHRQRLEKLNLEKDIRYCLNINQAPVIPILEGNTIVKLVDLPEKPVS